MSTAASPWGTMMSIEVESRPNEARPTERELRDIVRTQFIVQRQFVPGESPIGTIVDSGIMDAWVKVAADLYSGVSTNAEGLELLRLKVDAAPAQEVPAPEPGTPGPDVPVAPLDPATLAPGQYSVTGSLFVDAEGHFAVSVFGAKER